MNKYALSMQSQNLRAGIMVVEPARPYTLAHVKEYLLERTLKRPTVRIDSQALVAGYWSWFVTFPMVVESGWQFYWPFGLALVLGDDPFHLVAVVPFQDRNPPMIRVGEEIGVNFILTAQEFSIVA